MHLMPVHPGFVMHLLLSELIKNGGTQKGIDHGRWRDRKGECGRDWQRSKADNIIEKELVMSFVSFMFLARPLKLRD